AFAFHDLTALFAAGGFQPALTRYIAAHRHDDDPTRLRGIVRLGIGLPTGLAVVAGGILLVSAPWVAQTALGKPAMEDLLRLVAITLPATVLTDVALAATQGFKTMKPFVLVGFLFEPVFRLLLTVAVLAAGGGVEAAIVALMVTNYLAVPLALLSLKRLWRIQPGPAVYPVRELLAFSALAWASVIAIDAFIWGDTILLGIFTTAREVGIYQVATRLVLVSALVIVPMGLAFAPRIADLYRRGELRTLRTTYVTVTSWIVRLALLPFVFLLLFPRELLGLFGNEFKTGATVTILLAFGALIHASTGPSGTMLNMAGRPGLVLANNAATVVVNVGLNLILIPRDGIEGAAVAWLVSIVFTNAVFLIQIRMIFGVYPFGAAMLKGVLAAAAAVGVGVALKTTATEPMSFLIALAAIPSVYLVLLRMLGLSKDDRMVLDVLKRRLRRGPAELTPHAEPLSARPWRPGRRSALRSARRPRPRCRTRLP
ncbi:MAG TPA: flippase, partial [Actinomycetota bacterium]|nr:flippase [Actinomycetota bacterium]